MRDMPWFDATSLLGALAAAKGVARVMVRVRLMYGVVELTLEEDRTRPAAGA